WLRLTASAIDRTARRSWRGGGTPHAGTVAVRRPPRWPRAANGAWPTSLVPEDVEVPGPEHTERDHTGDHHVEVAVAVHVSERDRLRLGAQGGVRHCRAESPGPVVDQDGEAARIGAHDQVEIAVPVQVAQ